MKNKKILILSGSNGSVGGEIAKLFKSKGYIIIGIGSKKEPDFAYKKYIDQYFSIDFTKNKNSEKISKIFSSIELKADYLTLINNAGVSLEENIDKFKLDNWQKSLNINITAPTILTFALIKYCKQNNIEGSVLNIGSLSIFKGNKIYYASSKAALIGLTRSTSVNYSNTKIRSNCLIPGAIDSGMISDWSKEKRDKVASNTHIKRLTTPKEIAKTALFLNLKENDFLTGILLDLTSGQL